MVYFTTTSELYLYVCPIETFSIHLYCLFSTAQLDDEKTELKKSKAELKALHAYIDEKELESSSQSLKSNLKLLENENMQLKETCQSLESAVELLNVRLLSMNNIIKIQETELSRDGVHHVGEASAKMLSKWRDRVYALLVQLKSHEISENENMVKLQTKVYILMNLQPFHF